IRGANLRGTFADAKQSLAAWREASNRSPILGTNRSTAHRLFTPGRRVGNVGRVIWLVDKQIPSAGNWSKVFPPSAEWSRLESTSGKRNSVRRRDLARRISFDPDRRDRLRHSILTRSGRNGEYFLKNPAPK